MSRQVPRIFKTLLFWLWCFPQNMIGLIVKVCTGAKKRDSAGNLCIKHYLYNVRSGSVTLGEYIFLCPAHKGNARVLGHEHGHRRQSRMLGWLYIPVILLPSLIWAGTFEDSRGDYFSFYTEKWADKLGGVKRR